MGIGIHFTGLDFKKGNTPEKRDLNNSMQYFLASFMLEADREAARNKPDIVSVKEGFQSGFVYGWLSRKYYKGEGKWEEGEVLL